jgi:hypothetical protein
MSLIRQKEEQRKKRNEEEAKKLRKQAKQMDKARRKAANIKHLIIPSQKHNFKEEKRKQREIRTLACVQAQLEARKESRWQTVQDFAFSKFMVQRESYVRYELWTSELLGMDRTKLFDISLHLSTPQGLLFEEPVIPLPLREVHRRHHWQPRIRPYRPVFVTDGSKAVGEIPIERSRRFLAASARLFSRRFPLNSRFINGPSVAFLSMRTTSGEEGAESKDAAAPNKVIKGKKWRRNKTDKPTGPKPASKAPVDIFAAYRHDPDDWSIGDEEDTGSDWGDPDPDRDEEITTAPKIERKPKNKNKNKKTKAPTFAEYVDYDDPTLPTSEDIAIEKHNQWHQRYIRGDTLYWQEDSLTETLTSHLYFDDSSVPTSHYDPVTFIPDSQTSDIYFDEQLTRSASSDTSWFSIPDQGSDSTLYFSEQDIAASQHTPDLNSLISSGDSIYFESTPSLSATSPLGYSGVVASDSDSLYFHSITPPDLQDLGYFDTCSPLMTSSVELTSSTSSFSPRSQSSFIEEGGHCYASFITNDTSVYGNSSLSFSYVE